MQLGVSLGALLILVMERLVCKTYLFKLKYLSLDIFTFNHCTLSMCISFIFILMREECSIS
jgi:hypothetical protein